MSSGGQDRLGEAGRHPINLVACFEAASNQIMKCGCECKMCALGKHDRCVTQGLNWRRTSHVIQSTTQQRTYKESASVVKSGHEGHKATRCLQNQILKLNDLTKHELTIVTR